MKTKAIRLVVIALCLIGSSAMYTNIKNNANTIIPYVEDNGADAVNIVDLAKAMKTEVKSINGGVEMYLNNKRVVIYDNDSTMYINGSAVPYKTTKMKDSETGKTYEMPLSQNPTKSGDGYLISKTIIQDKIGIDCDSDGIHVKDITVASASSVDTSSLLSRTSTSTATNGWSNESGVWYYLKNGAKATGWVQDNSKWYYLGTDGKMKVGWVQDGSSWYYLNGDGTMAHDTTVSGYYLGSNGVWTTAPASTSSGTVTGISYSELLNRVEGIGFVSRQRFSAQEAYGDNGSGTAFYWKDNTYGSITIYDKGMLNVALRQNNAEYNNATKQLFNWLLPTQGDELVKLLCTNPTNETLNMDGRTVEIKLYDASISVTIKG